MRLLRKGRGRTPVQIARALDGALYTLERELEVGQIERLCRSSSTEPHELAFLSTLADHLSIAHSMLAKHRTPQPWRAGL